MRRGSLPADWTSCEYAVGNITDYLPQLQTEGSMKAAAVIGVNNN